MPFVQYPQDVNPIILWGVQNEQDMHSYHVPLISEFGSSYEENLEIHSGQETESTIVEVNRIFNVLRSLKVELKRPKEIEAYLTRHFNLTYIIRDICWKILKESRFQLSLSLELYRDPEISDSYLTLWISGGEFETVSRLIERLYDKYAKDFQKTCGWLLMTQRI